MFLRGKIFKLDKKTKVFGILITSTIIVHLAAWALEWKFGQTFFPLSENSVTFSELFSPGLDAGYFEHYQYILLLWCTILSSLLIFSRRLWGAFSIPIIYLFLFLDDSLQFHDRFYENLSNIFAPDKIIFIDQFLRFKDFSELIYWSLVFMVVLALSLPGVLKNNTNARSFIFNNYKLFFLLAFFGIFIDAFAANLGKYFHSADDSFAFFIRVFMILIEEIGEIGIIAAACIWLFGLNFRYQSK